MPAPAFRVGLQSLTLHPLRTLLSTLGVVIGAASLSAVLALGDGAEAFARQQVALEGLARVSLESLTSDLVDGHRVPRVDYPVFTPADAVGVAEAVPDARVTLEVSGTALSDAGETTRAVLLLGHFAAGAAGPPPSIVAGRAVRDDELREGARVVVLSTGAARALLDAEPAAAIGRHVTLGGEDLEVVGVTGGTPADRALRATTPFAVASRALVPVVPPRAPTIYVDVARAEDTAGARLRLERLVQREPAWTTRTRVQSRGPERLRQVAQGLLVLKLLLGAFASISLVVGGIGIMNVLLASVTERTREIGIRKAVGARRRDIVWQFLTEALAITSVGAALGVVLGLSTAYLVTAVIRSRTEALIFASVTPGSVLASAGVAIVVGMAFGLYPALRAARLPPIDAIVRE